MTETYSLSQIQEELKRLRLRLINAPISEKEVIADQILSLTEQKVGMSGRLDDMREKMHIAAEKAEKSVGTGGKGSKGD